MLHKLDLFPTDYTSPNNDTKTKHTCSAPGRIPLYSHFVDALIWPKSYRLTDQGYTLETSRTTALVKPRDAYRFRVKRRNK